MIAYLRNVLRLRQRRVKSAEFATLTTELKHLHRAVLLAAGRVTDARRQVESAMNHVERVFYRGKLAELEQEWFELTIRHDNMLDLIGDRFGV